MQHPNYQQLAQEGMQAEQLAKTFLRAYFDGVDIVYPLNPFQMLKDSGVAFTFISSDKSEGIYIAKEDTNDIPVAGINYKRPLTRQRFTAAHELCHHLKDSENNFTCSINSSQEIERYAENFAAALLMPADEIRKQADKYSDGVYVNLIDVLKIAEYFGVSFQAYLQRLAWDFNCIKGDTSYPAIKNMCAKFKPSIKRRELGFNNANLYKQLFDSVGEFLVFPLNLEKIQKYKTSCIFMDSRMEGIDVEQEKVSEIVVDIRIYGSNSEFYKPENKNLIEVTGLSKVYDYIFSYIEDGSFDLNVYVINELNKNLYKFAPSFEIAGQYRNSNTVVTGSSLDTIDYRKISTEMFFLDKDIQKFLNESESMPFSVFIEHVIKIHHRLTVIHPYNDGNGRSIRAFTNMLIMIKGLPPVLFSSKIKNDYKSALAHADENNFDYLFECYCRAIIYSYAEIFRPQ